MIQDTMMAAINAPMNGATKEEFDNWIKLATDNKINASNSWDVALIDYFHDLSVLREGDGINFQKASATLDGCVKIYTFRIDSAASEIGRLLSGLTVKKTQGGEGEEADDENMDGLEDGDENEIGDTNQQKKKRGIKSPGTLAKSFAQLKIKKMENSLILDPVFKKTLTEFDEGGAKSLLLNLLHVDKSGRVLFDTVETVIDNKEHDKDVPKDHDNHEPTQETGKSIDIGPLLNILGSVSALEDTRVCPSMEALSQISAAGTSPTNILETLQSSEAIEPSGVLFDDVSMGGAGALEPDQHSGMGNTSQINQVGPSDFSVFYAEDNRSNSGPNVTMLRLFNENFIEKTAELSHLAEMDLGLIQQFDSISAKAWAGPEHWKISSLRQKLKKTEETAINLIDTSLNESPASIVTPADRTIRKPKEQTHIDFFSTSDAVSDEDLFKRGKNITLPQSQWVSPTYNLLPDDHQLTTKKFIYLSLKPRQLIHTNLFGSSRKKVYEQAPYPEEKDTSIIDENYYAKRYGELEQTNGMGLRDKRLDLQDDLQEIHESFGNAFGDDQGLDADHFSFNGAQPASTQGYGSQLVQSLSKFKPNTINFARVAKRVDVRLLKDNLWSSFNSVKAFNAQQNNDTDKENEPIGTDPADDDGQEKNSNSAPADEFKFTDIMADISKKYSDDEKKDLSTSFCFICLLHLANENGFTIENNTDHSDLLIHE